MSNNNYSRYTKEIDDIMHINTIEYNKKNQDENHEIILNINMEDLMNIADVINKAFRLEYISGNFNYWDYCEIISLTELYKKLESHFEGSTYTYTDDEK